MKGFDAGADGRAGATRAGAAVTVEHVSRVLGGRPVLAGVELEAKPGTLVTLIGRSGCGKTTLLRLIAGLDAPDGGSVLVDGVSPERARARTRMVFQEARLLPWKSVRDNVALERSDAETKRLARQALERVGLRGREHDWPRQLSGGERQRLALARALVSRPSLLLLDEPLGALDALTRLDMQLLIERIWKEEGFTALLVTHDVHEAVALGDVVVSIDAGQIALRLPVDLPRPRDRQSPAFNRIVSRVLDHLLNPQPGRRFEAESASPEPSSVASKTAEGIRQESQRLLAVASKPAGA